MDGRGRGGGEGRPVGTIAASSLMNRRSTARKGRAWVEGRRWMKEASRSATDAAHVPSATPLYSCTRALPSR